MSDINPKTGKDWTNEELQARILELEAAAKNNSNKNHGPKEPELRITLDTGEIQLRHVTPTAITFPMEVWLKLFGVAPKVSDCIKQYKQMLSASVDDEIAVAMKRKLREAELATGNPIIRKPKVTKIKTA